MKKTANYLKGYAKMSSLLAKVAAQTWKTPSGLRADTVLGNTSYQHYNPEIGSVSSDSRFVLPPKILYSAQSKFQFKHAPKRRYDPNHPRTPNPNDVTLIEPGDWSEFLNVPTEPDRRETKNEVLERVWNQGSAAWANNPKTYSLREALAMRDSGTPGKFMYAKPPSTPEWDKQYQWARSTFLPVIGHEFGHYPASAPRAGINGGVA